MSDPIITNGTVTVNLPVRSGLALDRAADALMVGWSAYRLAMPDGNAIMGIPESRALARAVVETFLETAEGRMK